MIIETVKHKLVTDWTLIAHPDYQLYSNENNNYVVVDPDHSIVLNFAVDNTEVDIKHVTWEVAFKVKTDTRTITITSEPEVFEED